MVAELRNIWKVSERIVEREITDFKCFLLCCERHNMEVSTVSHDVNGAGQEGGAAEAQAGLGLRTPRVAARRPGRRPKLSGPQQAALVEAPSTCWIEVATARDKDGVLEVTPQR